MKYPENEEEALVFLYHRVADFLSEEGACQNAKGDDSDCGSRGTGCFYCGMAEGAEIVRQFKAEGL